MSETGLLFTGERFLPDCEREIWYEHFHRYTMALGFAEGKHVLDAACGEGYGSHVLAQKANSVVGVDVSESAINHAQKNYQQANLQFVKSNVLNMKFKDHSFDLVVSFETLEHLVEHDQLMAEFKRVLKPDGMLLISTPDKKEYSDKTGFDNEYHHKELYQHEFAELINNSFEYSQWYGQKLMFNSSIWRLHETEGSETIKQPLNSLQFDCMGLNEHIANEPLFNPVYFIVAASNASINPNTQQDFYCFTEQAEQIYGHYNAVIRAHIQAEKDCEKLTSQQQAWRAHPIIGRCIKWFGRDK